MAYGDVRLSAIANASGTATITIKSGRQRWVVSQISTQMDNAPAGSTCLLRKNGALVSSLVATGDVAGGDPPVEIGPNDALTVTWASVTAGLTGNAFVIYDDGNS